MIRQRSTLLTLLILLGSVAFIGGPTLAQTQSRDIFVSPQTGVGVGSVWGVFIGVSKYQHAELNLQYADKDARALHEFFTTQFQGRIHADQFKVLTNEQASRGNVLRAIKSVLRRAQPEDLVILSFAMHGLLDESGEDLYFLTHEADPNLPEDNGISRHDLLRQISKSKARKIVLLLDACHTGAFGSAGTIVAMRSANTNSINRLLSAMGQAQAGMAVLSSSSAAETSQEGEKFCGGHGAFTCGLLTGLQGEADTNRNGLVELRELYDHTYRAVKTSTDGYQNPAIEGRFDSGLPLAYTPGGASVPPSATAEGSGGSGATSAEMARIRAEFETFKQQMSQKGREEQARLETERSRLEAKRKEAEQLRAEQEQRLAEQQTRMEAERQKLAEERQHLAEEQTRREEEARRRAEEARRANEPPLIAKAPAFSVPNRIGREIKGKDGAPMVLIPEGEFIMGSSSQDVDRFLGESPLVSRGFFVDEQPQHRVFLDAFYLDKYEVTTSQFAKYLREVKGKNPDHWTIMTASRYRERPVIGVNWRDSKGYCTWAGKRLPTEAEWEKAARGTDGRTFPWGNETPTTRHGNFPLSGFVRGYSQLKAVGSFEAGKSPYGVYDMAGNAQEWVADWYEWSYYRQSPRRNPRGPSRSNAKVARGGSLFFELIQLRSANRSYGPPSASFGFRCAQDVK